MYTLLTMHAHGYKRRIHITLRRPRGYLALACDTARAAVAGMGSWACGLAGRVFAPMAKAKVDQLGEANDDGKRDDG